MTGTCKVCRGLIVGPAVLEIGPGRQKSEFLAFSQLMAKHLHDTHPQQLEVYAGLVTLVAQLFASLFADCPTADFDAAQSTMRRFLAERLLDAAVVIGPAPAPGPLVEA